MTYKCEVETLIASRLRILPHLTLALLARDEDEPNGRFHGLRPTCEANPLSLGKKT